MKTVWVDTNVLLRFLLNDVPDQWKRADALMRQAAAGKLVVHVSVVVVAEVVAVLHHTFRKPLPDIARVVGGMLSARGVSVEDGAIVLEALRRSGELKVDFVDAYVAMRARDADEEIASFDADLPRKLGAATFRI